MHLLAGQHTLTDVPQMGNKISAQVLGAVSTTGGIDYHKELALHLATHRWGNAMLRQTIMHRLIFTFCAQELSSSHTLGDKTPRF